MAGLRDARGRARQVISRSVLATTVGVWASALSQATTMGVCAPTVDFARVSAQLQPRYHYQCWCRSDSAWGEEAVLDLESLGLPYADSIPSASSRLASIAFLASSLSSASLSGVGDREGLRFSKSSAMTFSEK